MIFILVFSGCSNLNPNNKTTNTDNEYSSLIAQAKELDKQGKPEEAFDVIAKLVIKTEDMEFLTSLLDQINKVEVPLVITGQSSKRDGEYMVTKGSLKNDSTDTFDNVKVKVIFSDDAGNVVDTDWTYAVDSVGIKPNESKQFELMTKYVKGMSKVKFEIIQ
jgi:hypothetical protein